MYFIFIFSATDITYLNLTIQGGVYEIIRKAGFPEVKWIIQVLAYPKPTLVWYVLIYCVLECLPGNSVTPLQQY